MADVIDVWTAHPTPRFAQHEMFESLHRRTGTGWPTEELPLEQTIAAMDAAGATRGLIRAWCGSEGPLISNDEVAGFVACHPNRLVGLASVHLRRPVCAGGCPWTAEMIALAAGYPNVHIDASTHTARRGPPDLDSEAAELLLSADAAWALGL